MTTYWTVPTDALIIIAQFIACTILAIRAAIKRMRLQDREHDGSELRKRAALR